MIFVTDEESINISSILEQFRGGKKFKSESFSSTVVINDDSVLSYMDLQWRTGGAEWGPRVGVIRCVCILHGKHEADNSVFLDL